MKRIYTLCTLLVLSSHATFAQTHVLNWATNTIVGWISGLFSGTATNINNSTVNATINITSNQGNSTFTSFSDFTSPSVVASPFTTQLAWLSNVPNIAIGCNFSNKANYTDVVINFNKLVQNVRFNIADIDKNAGSNDYYDQVTVTATNAGNAVTNPTLTKYVTGSNYFTISGNTATANTNNSQGGNSSSSWYDQDATAIVNFGTAILDRITIRYTNAAAAKNNPDEQAIAIGNISFERATALPLTLTSFNGSIASSAVQLIWTTAQEENLDKYIVEKSTDAVTWQTLTTVHAAGNSTIAREYKVTDPQTAPVNYYRLKQVDRSGSFTYSQIITLKGGTIDRNSLKLYPNPVTNAATISINSTGKLTAHIKVYNQLGTQLQHWQQALIAGSNNIPVQGITLLPLGSYIITVEDETGKKIGTAQFIKH